MERGYYRGVPVFHESVPGAQAICLMFRVGMADEALPVRGLTHLVEHIALLDHDDPAVRVNGSVDSHVCRFFATGSDDGLWRFIDAIGAALGRMDNAAIARESGVLAVEAQQPRPVQAQHHLRRHGATGLGVTAFSEFGIRGVTPDAFAKWRTSHFVASNASIWSTVDPPDRGNDTLLLDGDRCPPPHRGEMLSPKGFFRLNANVLSVSAVLDREISAVIGVEALRRRFEQRIRREEGLSYSVQAAYELTSTEQCHVSVSVDCEASRSPRVFKELQEELSVFLRSGPEAGRLEALIEEIQGQQDTANARAGVLDAAAHAELFGSPIMDCVELSALRERVSVESVASALAPIAETTIWQITQHMGDVAGVPNLDAPDRVTIRGEEHGYVNLHSRSDLAAGVITAPPGHLALRDGAATVQMDMAEVEAGLCWGDGGRHLIDRRGHSLVLEPTRWQRGNEARVLIDAAIPPEARLDRGFRSAAPVVPIVPSNRLWRLARRLAPIAGPYLVLIALVADWALSLWSIPWGALGGALTAWAWVDTRVAHPTIFEDAAFRSRMEEYPRELGPAAAARWGAPILLWARAAGHLRPEVVDGEPDVWAELDEGSIGAAEAFWRLGGVLATDMFSDTANEFLYDVALRGRKSRRWLGVRCYVHVLDEVSVRERVDLFMKTSGSAPLVAVAEGLDSNFMAWRRVRFGHRVVRVFVLNKYFPDRGTGARFVRFWQRFRLRRAGSS